MISKRIVIISICIFAILSIPLISMQYTEEVNWSVQDFIIAAILFLGAGISLEYIFKKNYKTNHRIILISALMILIILIWIELAVGIFGSPIAGS